MCRLPNLRDHPIGLASGLSRPGCSKPDEGTAAPRDTAERGWPGRFYGFYTGLPLSGQRRPVSCHSGNAGRSVLSTRALSYSMTADSSRVSKQVAASWPVTQGAAGRRVRIGSSWPHRLVRNRAVGRQAIEPNTAGTKSVAARLFMRKPVSHAAGSAAPQTPRRPAHSSAAGHAIRAAEHANSGLWW
jgi:hypothetical protein